MAKRALLLINRHSRRGQEFSAQATQLLQETGIQLIEVPNAAPQAWTEVIRTWADRVDLVIVGGGDGTLNRAAEGLVATQLPLMILPLGTANDLARTLRLPKTLPEACQILQKGQTRRIDLGWVNGKYFFNVASLGLSTQITEKLSHGAKRRWGVLSYGLTAFQVLLQARPFRAEIRSGGEVIKVKTLQIAIGNGCFYGGGLQVAPDAAIDDQRLDCYSLETKKWWQVPFLIPALSQGKPGPWLRTLASQEIEIHTRRPYRITTDGEMTSQTPAMFRMVPQALTVLV